MFDKPATVFLVDYDQALNRDDSTKDPGTWLIAQNARLFEHIKPRCQVGCHAIIASFSLRSCEITDKFTSFKNKSPSSFSAWLYLQHHLNQLLPEHHVVFDPFLLGQYLGASTEANPASLFNDSAQATRQFFEACLAKGLHPDYSSTPPTQEDLIDPTQPHGSDLQKISYVYVAAHRAACQFPQVEIHIYEDRKDLIEANSKFFGNNPNLLPDSVKVHYWHYGETKDLSPQDCGMIQGTGLVDHYHQWSFRYIFARTCALPEKQLYPPILKFEALRQIHATGYPFRDPDSSKFFPEQLNVRAFLQFRAERLWTQDESLRAPLAEYLTAEQLNSDRPDLHLFAPKTLERQGARSLLSPQSRFGEASTMADLMGHVTGREAGPGARRGLHRQERVVLNEDPSVAVAYAVFT